MRRERRPEEREDEEQREATPAPPQHQLLQLQRTLGNRAVAQMLARNASGAPPIKDRAPIDDLAKKQNVAPADRVRTYAQIAGTQAVGLDPAVVHAGTVKEGVNVGALKQADEVGAQAGFVEGSKFSGGAPPEKATGVAIVVYTSSTRFEDEDYMVAAIRHEMVHARLMKLTLEHRNAWTANPGRLSFAQYVDQKVGGSDAALIKDRFFGGHMDETVAYAEGFLTAFFYSPLEEPADGDRAWVAHFKGFTKEFQNARLNSGPIPKKLPPNVPESNIAMKQSANAVVTEAEKLVKEFCDAGGAAKRKNLAAWMERLYKTEGFHDAALKMVYRVATGGKALPEPKKR
ncbi:MAG: hypothetical protein ABW081_05760 [Solirubrobacteraceae bacterium]